MKVSKFLSLVLLIISVGFIGCKKKEEPEVNPYSKILGKWALTRLDAKHDGITESQYGVPGDFAKFEAGGKFSGNILSTSTGIVTSTWELIGNKVIKIKSTADADFPTHGFDILIIEDYVMVVSTKRDGAEGIFYFNRIVE